MKRLLIAITDREISSKIKREFGSNYTVDQVQELSLLIKQFSEKRYDFLLVELSYLKNEVKNRDYRALLKNFWMISPDVDIIVYTKTADIREAVEVVKSGASDYLTTPLNVEEMRHVLGKIEDNAKLINELNYLRRELNESSIPFSLSTKSSIMLQIFSDIRSVAGTESTVLLTGETGTGKGLIAKIIHNESKRRENQFLSVHCGAIPDSLLESELFGHEKGAFTGAIRRKLGKFEIADKGTIFLDEIGTISPAMQIKLLQVLQEKSFFRVGGEELIKTNVRIIAATNSDLAKLTQEDKFRLDLYYRLNVFQIELPPLRKRIEDLEILIQQILNKLNKFHGKSIFEVEDEVLQALREYEWPGNIRELENLLERAYILETTNTLTSKSFPIRLFKEKFNNSLRNISISSPLHEVRKCEIEKIEEQYLSQLLEFNNGRIKESAAQAGIGERQLNKLINKYDLDKNKFKKRDNRN